MCKRLIHVKCEASNPVGFEAGEEVAVEAGLLLDVAVGAAHHGKWTRSE